MCSCSFCAVVFHVCCTVQDEMPKIDVHLHEVCKQFPNMNLPIAPLLSVVDLSVSLSLESEVLSLL